MSFELPAYCQDVRWLCIELQRRGQPPPAEGQCAEFAERVAIKLDGDADDDSVREARLQALDEFMKSILNKGSVKLVIPVANPRYDELYNQGVKWLDSL